jgi:hypothetical protein
MRLPDVEYYDRDSLAASLAEDEIRQDLANVGYDRGIEGIIFAIEFCFAFHASKFDVCGFLTQYFTTWERGAPYCN